LEINQMQTVTKDVVDEAQAMFIPEQA